MTEQEPAGGRADGYRGIWFELGQFDGEYGDKYSGGLGTYTSKHVPMAAYAPAVEKTFFTYGGTTSGDRDLQIMASYYDHYAHEVPRPTVVDEKPEPDPPYDSDTVVDPHDNASLILDGEGHIWVFVAGRSRRRPGRVYRSVDPYDIAAFELLHEIDLFAYPQPRWVDSRAAVCFTVYDEDGNRELFRRTVGADGLSPPTKLVGFGGHYQVSEPVDGHSGVADDDRQARTTAVGWSGGGLVTAFNWHPDGDVDRRTNLYVMRTPDGGRTWETADGRTLDPPLDDPANEALAVDYRARGRLVYLNDVAVDADGNPVVLSVTSRGPEPGPTNGPRRWRVTHWDGAEWRTHTVTTSDHNYDSGSVYVTDGAWWVVGPTEPGPQSSHSGGQVAVWRSADRGATWNRIHAYPTRGARNATYARRPRGAAPPFAAFWADGDASQPSDSRLYIGSLDGRCWQLPGEMDGPTAEPLAVSDSEE